MIINAGEKFMFIFLALEVAGNVLLALLLFARVLSALVTRRRSVRGPAHANRPDPRANVVSGFGVQRVLSGGKNVRSWMPASVSARPPREPAGVEAQAAKSSGSEPLAA